MPPGRQNSPRKLHARPPARQGRSPSIEWQARRYCRMTASTLKHASAAATYDQILPCGIARSRLGRGASSTISITIGSKKCRMLISSGLSMHTAVNKSKLTQRTRQCRRTSVGSTRTSVRPSHLRLSAAANERTDKPRNASGDFRTKTTGK